MSLRSVVCFVGLCGLVSAGSAWWPKGHEQVADIAWTRLSESTKKEVALVLKAGEPEFRPASDSEPDVRAAFRKAATCSDWVKDHKEGIFEEWIQTWNAKFQPGYDPTDTNREAHRCKRWHYFDVPVRFKGEKPGVEGSNALVAMTAGRYELTALKSQDPKDRKSQCWWLYWMTHIVGDLHQPLHCVSDHTHEEAGDAGGNLFKLGIGYPDNPDRMMNLHALWDSGIELAIAAESWDKPGPEAVTERWMAAYAPSESDLGNMDVAQWIAHGSKLALSSVYEGLDRGGKPSEDYKVRQLDLCRRQAVLAGLRLAKEINLGLGSTD